MNLYVTGSTIFGIVIALVIMWFSLRKYEGFFEDKKMFKSLIIGFFTGFLAFLIESFAYGIGIIFVALFPLMEQLIKLIGINLPPYQDKRETIIYGLVMGLGFGSIFMPLLVISASRAVGISSILHIGALIAGVSYILFHGGTGCILGYGVSKSEKWKYLFYATILGIPLPVLEMQTFYLKGIIEILILKIIEISYCFILFIMVYRRILPNALPRRKRKELF